MPDTYIPWNKPNQVTGTKKEREISTVNLKNNKDTEGSTRRHKDKEESSLHEQKHPPERKIKEEEVSATNQSVT